MNAALCEPAEDLRELLLLGRAEAAGDVCGEIGGRRHGDVRRIEVDEVTLLGELEDAGEVAVLDRDVAKRTRARVEVADVAEQRLREAPERDVELAGAIDAIEPVVARLVEEDRARRALGRREIHRVLRANLVVVLALVAVTAKGADDRLDVVANRDVAVHELRVHVAQERGHVRPPRAQVEEQRGAADERLEVALEGLRQEGLHLLEQLRLAPDPLQERARSRQLLGGPLFPREGARSARGRDGFRGSAHSQDHASVGRRRESMRGTRDIAPMRG